MIDVAGKPGRPAYRVIGPSYEDATMSGALIELVLDYPGSTLWPDPVSGVPAPIRVTERFVHEVLLKIYQGKAHQVAEAIRSLRQVSPERAAWLERLLGDSPLLRDFGHAILRR
jgi:hypothetical protein